MRLTFSALLVFSSVCLFYFINAHSIRSHNSLELSEDNMKVGNEDGTVEFLTSIVSSRDIGKIGQIGGLDTNHENNLLVFHRGNRRWSIDSFSGERLEHFDNIRYPAIKQDVLSLVDLEQMKIVANWGKDKFYMPHGLTVDFEGNIWLTDVGMHQVFKYNFAKSSEPELVLGVKFQPANDDVHFCKPTDVAVSKLTGDIFVSDGYCNQRVVQFRKNGEYIRSFEDVESPLIVPHSLTLIDELGLVCTVSRQEGRIVCFDIESGEVKYNITQAGMDTVYAIAYCHHKKVLHAATGSNGFLPGTGFTFNAREENFGELVNEWQTNNRDLDEVHDIAVNRTDGSLIYDAQLNGEIDVFAVL